MAGSDGWDAGKMFELYLHDYMVKRKMHKTAAIFRNEANVGDTQVVVDSTEGFLHEWWSPFYDTYASRQLKYQPAKEGAPIQVPMNRHWPGPLPVIADHADHVKFGAPSACILARKMYEEDCLRHHTATFNPNLGPLDVNKPSFPMSAAIGSSHPQQQTLKRAQIQDISMEKTTPMDSMLYGIPEAELPITGPYDAVFVGMNQGINSAPLNGWPLTVANSQKQFQMLTLECYQPPLAQVLSSTHGKQASTFPGSPVNFGSPNLMLPSIESSMKNGQTMVQMKRTLENQFQHDELEHQQLLENGRKRNTKPYSRAQDHALDFKNTEGKPVENVESFLPHNDQSSESSDSTSTPFGSSKHRSVACIKDGYNGFTFEEVITLQCSNGLSCCHFSSDGELLASAGNIRKVMIWDMETYGSISTSKGHTFLITDLRFRPSSTLFATSSVDRTVRIWDAARPNKSLYKLLGHAQQVMSLDFHPQKLDLLCSCDLNNEIRLWNINNHSCTRVSKGATKQVRFQPQFGKILATVARNIINLIDVETDSLQFYLKGHVKDILSICWDTSGKYIASVSEDSARVWSAISGGKCINELSSNGKKFRSCTFHPGYSQLLIIGGDRSLELWDPTENNKTCSVPAHDGLIAALVDSPQTGMVASTCRDDCVKLWK
ncbi:transcriptional corepressor LEUNIG-like isoform X3 [Carya illinoinensis]|uniref:Transcriptional corepressor LEUNIG-like n=1 Tax=Carya illinoinensis TaxID=32201 RepID=A0A8T1PAX2_CARIL|nr:transcriptional corepressor LEUNIG-like isoform X3 [Carya illinoinensis]KAG6638672.1 hypothetical protein CIPAW_10G050500 [Carya illinoinensis]KAG6638673.1 hypothetical protein CIPAW_10G050500 [Carya illinoinensis]